MGIGLTLQEVQGWQGQYARMVRWRDRVVAAANGDRSPDELDFLFASFESAFHLRDWLVKSDALSAATLDQFFAAHTEMRICRDIANGFKHYSISRPSVDAEFAVVNQYVPENWPSRYKFPNGEWTVLAGGHQVGLVELAENVAGLWHAFLVRTGLLNA